MTSLECFKSADLMLGRCKKTRTLFKSDSVGGLNVVPYVVVCYMILAICVLFYDLFPHSPCQEMFWNQHPKELKRPRSFDAYYSITTV